MCTQWCVRFQKKKKEVNPKIKKAERVLVRLFRILKISCSWLSGLKQTQKQKIVSNTNDIRARKGKENWDRSFWVQGKQDLIFFPRNFHFLCVVIMSSFPFLARLCILFKHFSSTFAVSFDFYVFFNGYCNHLGSVIFFLPVFIISLIISKSNSYLEPNRILVVWHFLASFWLFFTPVI